MKTIDKCCLCQLIQKTLQHTERSEERNNAIEALCLMIEQIIDAKQLTVDKNLQIYIPEALKKTEEEVTNKIHKFPDIYKLNLENIDCKDSFDAEIVFKYFLKWLKVIITKDCIDAYRSAKRKPTIISLNRKIVNDNNAIEFEENTPDKNNINSIDLLIEDELQSMSRKLREYIDKDFGNKLSKCHPKGNSKCHCQILIQKRFIEKNPHTGKLYTLKEISEELETSLQTINTRLKDFCLPLLKEIIKELGYE